MLRTVWLRLTGKLGIITADTVSSASRNDIQDCGISFRKTDCIKDFAQKVCSGEFDLDGLSTLSDTEVINKPSTLKGIGVWAAEMLMIFCMQRPDVVSFGDFAIQRGLRRLYHHPKIDRELFRKYARRYSPYGTIASLYLRAISSGAIPDMRDYAPEKSKKQMLRTVI